MGKASRSPLDRRVRDRGVTALAFLFVVPSVIWILIRCLSLGVELVGGNPSWVLVLLVALSLVGVGGLNRAGVLRPFWRTQRSGPIRRSLLRLPGRQPATTCADCDDALEETPSPSEVAFPDCPSGGSPKQQNELVSRFENAPSVNTSGS